MVAAYRRPRELAELLVALGDQHELVVVNVTADPLVTAAAVSAGARCIDIIDNPGFAAAVNAGAKAALTPYVAFMNDDLLVDGSAVSVLRDTLVDHGADVVVPAIHDAAGAREPSIAALPTPGRLLVEWALLPDQPVSWLEWLPVEKWRHPEGAEVVHAASAAIVLTTRALMSAVPLPEEYFLYWEESEWFWTLRELRKVTIYTPSAAAVHAGGRQDVRSEKSALMARNAVRCVRRTQGPAASLHAWVAVVLWNLRLAVLAAGRHLGGDRERSHLRARWVGLCAAVGAIGETMGATRGPR